VGIPDLKEPTMKRAHALLIAFAIGVAAIFGTFAASHSVRLGRSSTAPAMSSAQIAAHNRALDRAEVKLRRMLTEHPAATQGAAGRQRVIYVRPAPHIVTLHHGHGEAEGGEREAEGHDGSGFDD
jgi:hypothetical protein